MIRRPLFVLMLLYGYAAFGPSALAQGRPSAAELDEVKSAVAAIYQWEMQYAKTVDGLIEATRQYPSFWSGTGNADTEDERIARVRELLIDNRETTLDRAGTALLETMPADRLLDHLERIVGGATTSADADLSNEVHNAYRDAIMSGMTTFGVQANQEIEGF